MNWYIKTANLENAIQNAGLSPDVTEYILNISDKFIQGQVFNYARQNPGITLQDLKQW